MHTAPGPVEVHCVEASKNHFARLVVTKAKFFSNAAATTQWHLHNLAMSEAASGMLPFSDDGCGELCSIGGRAHQRAGLQLTVSSNVDTLVSSIGGRIALLKVDTEGHEPSVLRGARSSLRARLFDVVAFEHSGSDKDDWSHVKLMDVVDELSGYGYVCFYDGAQRAIQLTGCPSERWNHKHWSNVVCVDARQTHLVKGLFNGSIGGKG